VGKRSRERQRERQRERSRQQGTNAGRAHRAGRGERTEHAGRAGRAEQQVREALHEIADEFLSAAVHARIDEDEAGVARHVDALLRAPGDDGRRLVARTVTAWFDKVVEDAWKNGWQPADLVRVVGRDAGGRQARIAVDAVAGQMRRYAAATVDERWEAQLEALGAAVWWPDDGTWLQAWADREHLDAASALREAIDVLACLHTLPGLPILCPPPGTARRGSLHRDRTAGSTIDPRILDRVRGLLAKAESTAFAEEAEALTEKAQELMSRHSIDYALLAAEQGARDEPGGIRIGVDNPYEMAKALLLDKVASANRCKSVWTKQFGFAAVIGFESDLAAVELLYTSLLVQATSAMMREGSRQDRYGRSTTRSFRQSFLTGFATRIGERLTAARDQAGAQAAAESGDGRLLPVLAARDNAVNEATDQMYPDMTAKPVKAGNYEGLVTGRAAADLASLQAHRQVGKPRPE
jgi:hypothetical protein